MDTRCLFLNGWSAHGWKNRLCHWNRGRLEGHIFVFHIQRLDGLEAGLAWL